MEAGFFSMLYLLRSALPRDQNHPRAGGHSWPLNIRWQTCNAQFGYLKRFLWFLKYLVNCLRHHYFAAGEREIIDTFALYFLTIQWKKSETCRLLRQYPQSKQLGKNCMSRPGCGSVWSVRYGFYSLWVTQLTARCLRFLAARQRHHSAVQPAAGGLRQRQDSEEQQLQQICKSVFHFVRQMSLSVWVNQSVSFYTCISLPKKNI